MARKRGDQRTKEQRERDLELVAELRLQGLSQPKIAAMLGISQQTVSIDLKFLRGRWAKATNETTEKMIGESLARHDAVYAECWKNHINRLSEDGGCGDPRWLANALRCEEKRIELLGIKPPQKVAPTTPDGKEQYSGVLVVPGMQSAEEWLASSDDSTEPDPA